MATVKIKINGKTVQAESGMNLIQAARLIGIEIPHFCYHEGLSIAGNCRMCLVELENQWKLQPGCATYVQEGLSFFTDTEKVKEARRVVLEFLLVNHPLDCPICDQAGECKLQDYYMLHGKYNSRFKEDKIKRQKAKPVGPHIILDQERCVQCLICVRFSREIDKTNQIGLFKRGDYECIDIYNNQLYDNMYSGNVADMCPVGALTDRNFRFHCRVWFLKSADSICSGCSRGCNISLQHQEEKPYLWKGKRIMRIKPRFNREVNKWWICDLGRYGMNYIDENRLTEPQRKQNGSLSTISWNEAYTEIAGLINETARKDPSRIAAILSPHLTNEDLFVCKEFLTTFGVKDYHYSAVSSNTYHDDYLINEDKFPNSKGAALVLNTNGIKSTKEILEKAKNGAYSVLFIAGQNLVKAYGENYIRECLSRVNTIIMLDTNEQPTSAYAHYLLPAAAFAEKGGSFINFEGRIQLIKKAFPPIGSSKPDWSIFSELSTEMNQLIKYTSEKEIFAKMTQAYPQLNGLDYQKIGPNGMIIK